MKSIFISGWVLICVWVAMVVGWIMNLIEVINLIMNNGPITTMFIGRCVGIFLFPLGGILGYL